MVELAQTAGSSIDAASENKWKGRRIVRRRQDVLVATVTVCHSINTMRQADSDDQLLYRPSMADGESD